MNKSGGGKEGLEDIQSFYDSLLEIGGRVDDLRLRALRYDNLLRLAQWVKDIMRPGTSLTITCRPRQEWGEDGEFTAEIQRAGREARRGESDAIEDFIEVLHFGAERWRRCRRCGKEKPYSAFSYRRDGADHKNSSCLECERDRVRRHSRRKKEARQRAAQEAAQKGKG